MSLNSRHWKSLGKCSSIYGRPKTRNPFPLTHLESCPRISTFIQPSEFPRDKKETQLPTIRTRKYPKPLPLKALSDSKTVQYYHSVAQFRKKLLEKKYKNAENEQSEGLSYKLTFYNPKEGKREEKVRKRYVSYIESSRNFELVPQADNSSDKVKPQTTIS
eukprot:TRINITY_DN1222_c0_g2_i4.p1 TRINITY_DN1222_c0_g2~~TRINITY_DN1222_c0_g2_i4.p1  ORF type:complete len:161 (-),score=28.11 TRINITY_DN1222_c0_g2_i4:278-760(-)